VRTSTRPRSVFNLPWGTFRVTGHTDARNRFVDSSSLECWFSIAPLPELPVAVIITPPVGSVVDNLMASAPAPADSTPTEGAATDTLPPSTVRQGLTLLHFKLYVSNLCEIHWDVGRIH
jgi:hypothetical protein